MSVGHGCIPYTQFLGYDKGADGGFVINEEQAKIVRRIFNEFIDGKNLSQIARGLRSDGIKTVTGKDRWHVCTIRSILENEKYMGDCLMQKYYTSDFLTKKQVKNQGELEQYMGTGRGAALHTDTKKPVAKAGAKKTSGQKIADAASKLAYSSNTRKARYGTGKPKDGFIAALNKAYPNRTWTRVCSCDIFVGVCVRYAGVDKTFPRGLSRSYLERSDKFRRVSVTEDSIKDGDIIVTKGNKHICIHVGGKIKEASLGRKYRKNGKTCYSGFYGKTTDTLHSRLKGAHVYRAK